MDSGFRKKLRRYGLRPYGTHFSAWCVRNLLERIIVLLLDVHGSNPPCPLSALVCT